MLNRLAWVEFTWRPQRERVLDRLCKLPTFESDAFPSPYPWLGFFFAATEGLILLSRRGAIVVAHRPAIAFRSPSPSRSPRDLA